MLGVFFAFNPFPPHLLLNVSLRVPSPPDVCCCRAIPSTILLSAFIPHCLLCLSLMDGFSGFWKLGPPQGWGGPGGGWAQVHMAGHWAVLKTDFSLASLASAPLPVCIFPKFGRPLPSASLELSLVSRGQTCPAGGRHSLSFRAVFIFGLREVLNGPDTGLGD